MESTLRDRVAGFLTASQLSQAELARRCGISRQRLQQILDGESVPSLPLAVRLEDVTGIPTRAWAEGHRAAPAA